MNLTASEVSKSIELLDNAVLAWGLAACGFAQLSKLVVEIIQFKRWRPSVLIETGGMPSSHAALMTGTAAGIGWEIGFNDPVFAMSATIAFVVMYDASGIRREAGITASQVNKIPEKIWELPPSKPLKENLGHTRIQVLIGSLIGPAIALPGIVFIGSPLNLLNIITTNLN